MHSPYLRAVLGIGRWEVYNQSNPPGEGVVYVAAEVGRQDDNTFILLNLLQKVASLDVGIAVVGVGHAGALTEDSIGLVKK